MKKIFWAYVILFVISFVVLCFILLSCNVTKHSKSSNSDSTNVSKHNSSSVDTSKSGGSHKENNATKENTEWWKTTLKFDTGKNSVTNVYPSTIIYEGGKGQKETQSNTSDSSWKNDFRSFMENKFDSMNNKISSLEEDKKSKTGGMPLWFWLLIGGLGFILYEIAKTYLGKFTVVKKVISQI